MISQRCQKKSLIQLVSDAFNLSIIVGYVITRLFHAVKLNIIFRKSESSHFYLCLEIHARYGK